jgi:hypothetical protein
MINEKPPISKGAFHFSKKAIPAGMSIKMYRHDQSNSPFFFVSNLPPHKEDHATQLSYSYRVAENNLLT